MKYPRSGNSSACGLILPDVTITSMHGQRWLTAHANSRPSIDPGISISVSTNRISGRLSRMRMPSSASAASTTLKPASSATFAARLRTRNSSSIIRTTDLAPTTAPDWSQRPYEYDCRISNPQLACRLPTTAEKRPRQPSRGASSSIASSYAEQREEGQKPPVLASKASRLRGRASISSAVRMRRCFLVYLPPPGSHGAPVWLQVAGAGQGKATTEAPFNPPIHGNARLQQRCAGSWRSVRGSPPGKRFGAFFVVGVTGLTGRSLTFMEVNEVFFWFAICRRHGCASGLAWASPVSFADVATGVGMTAASDRRRPVRRRTARDGAPAPPLHPRLVFLPRSWLGSPRRRGPWRRSAVAGAPSAIVGVG